MPVGDIYQTTFMYTMWGQRLMNVLHWRTIESSGEPGEMVRTQAVANEVGDHVSVGRPAHDVRQFISEDVQFDFVRCQLIAPIRYAYRDKIVNVAGVRDVNQFPNVDTYVQKLIDFARTGGQRGVHFPPGGATDYVDGLLEADVFKPLVIDNTSWMYTDILVPGIGTTIRPVVWYGTDAIPNYDNVSGRFVQEEARVMTRRTVGRGI